MKGKLNLARYCNAVSMACATNQDQKILHYGQVPYHIINDRVLGITIQTGEAHLFLPFT